MWESISTQNLIGLLIYAFSFGPSMPDQCKGERAKKHKLSHSYCPKKNETNKTYPFVVGFENWVIIGKKELCIKLTGEVFFLLVNFTCNLESSSSGRALSPKQQYYNSILFWGWKYGFRYVFLEGKQTIVIMSLAAFVILHESSCVHVFEINSSNLISILHHSFRFMTSHAIICSNYL